MSRKVIIYFKTSTSSCVPRGAENCQVKKKKKTKKTSKMYKLSAISKDCKKEKKNWKINMWGNQYANQPDRGNYFTMNTSSNHQCIH